MVVNPNYLCECAVWSRCVSAVTSEAMQVTALTHLLHTKCFP